MLSGRRRGSNRIGRALRELRSGTEVDSRVSSRFGRGGEFSARVASTAGDRVAAWRLAYREYRRMGFAEHDPLGLWYSLFDALPRTTTILVEHGRALVGVVTVVPDSPMGLPADRTFPQEMRRLRRGSGQLAEAVSLVQACEGARSGALVISKLCELTCLCAERVLGAGALAITVNPHHRGYYEKLMRFRTLASGRDCARVAGAPAVLMALDFRDMAGHLAAARRARPARTLYRRFMNDDEAGRTARHLASRSRPLDPDALREFFVTRRPLIPAAGRTARNLLAECYPECDLRSGPPAESNTTLALEAVK